MCVWPQALESFVTRCPSDVAPFVDSVIALALEYISYDPNYTDDGAEEGVAPGGLERDSSGLEALVPCTRFIFELIV